MALFPLAMLAQTANPRKDAEKMNQRAQIIYYELEEISLQPIPCVTTAT